MPLTFPSHQGLVAPLWRRWPDRFHVLGLCVGAAMPDVVDGVLGAWRGYLGQWYGHTLIGLFALCLPLGLVLTWLTLLAGEGLAGAASGRLAWLGRGIRRLDNAPARASPAGRALFATLSLGLGAFSHLVFDLLSHGNFKWLYPWYENPRLFPSWWYAEWFTVWVPGYREPYPVGPHLLVWLALSLLGAVLLLLPLRRMRSPHAAAPSTTTMSHRRSRVRVISYGGGLWPKQSVPEGLRPCWALARFSAPLFQVPR